MNADVQQHLSKAKSYLAKGDEYYAKAADEIIAALAADPTLSRRKIAEQVGRSHTWINQLVKWRETGSAAFPFGGREPAGSQALRAAKQVLGSASEEVLDKIIGELGAARRADLWAALEAAGDKTVVIRPTVTKTTSASEAPTTTGRPPGRGADAKPARATQLRVVSGRTSKAPKPWSVERLDRVLEDMAKPALQKFAGQLTTTGHGSVQVRLNVLFEDGTQIEKWADAYASVPGEAAQPLVPAPRWTATAKGRRDE